MTLAQPHEVVRASAGAGKTYALATRYLRLLHEGASPDTILATTFTRKAAGEILERVLQRLAKAAQDPDQTAKLAHDLRDPNPPHPPAITIQDCRRMLATVCRSLHRVWISTLDSLFYRMALCYRYELGLPPQPRIADNNAPAVTQLRLHAIDAMLADDDLPTLLQMIRHLEYGNAPRRVTDIINKIVGGELYDVFREAPDANLWSRLQTPPGLLGPPALAQAINAMRDLSEKMDFDKRWAKSHHDSLNAAMRRDWKTFLKKGIAPKIVAGEEKYNRCEIPADVAAAYQTLIDHAHAQLIDRVARQTQATHRLLERFDQHFTRLRYEHGILLYSDIPMLLSQQLPATDQTLLADLYYRLDTRVTHLLLDEFQDTSLPQWKILQPFAKEIRAYGDGSRTFYCVGDAKQAIYGWRGGCAEIFDHIEDTLNLPHDTQHNLNQSYRSSQIVLDAVNRVFAGLANNDALAKAAHDACDWQARFQEHTAHHTDRPGYVELVTSPAAENKDNGSHADTPESDTEDGDAPLTTTPHDEYTAGRIAAIAAAAPGKTIGVLVNQNKKAHLLINLLHSHGLTASGEGADPLTDDAAVGVILSALTLADHPGHSAAVFHVLHSPLGSALGLESEQSTHVATVARRIRQSLLTHGYADLITNWAQHLAPSCDERNTQRLVQLIELAQHHDTAITLRPKDFVAYVQSTRVEEPRAALIRVMTVNKAKGLEFDIVVLPELQRTQLNESGALVYTLRPSPTDPVKAVYRGAAKEVRALSNELDAAYQQRVTRQFHDDLSKLYVAMTRSRHALHMIIEPRTENKDGSRSAKGWSTPSFAAILRHALCGTEEHFKGEQTLYTHGHADWMIQNTNTPTRHPVPEPVKPKRVEIRLAQPKDEDRTAGRSWHRVSPSSLESAGRVDVPDLLAIHTPQAQQRGSLIHAWFELIDWLTPPPPDTYLDDDHLAAIASQMFPEKDHAWVNDQITQFRRMLEWPTVIEALSLPDTSNTAVPQPQLWRERSFAVRIEERMLRGKFDRVVIRTLNDKPTHADLIDFKTDRVTPETLARTIERYQPQMQAYRQALSIMLALPSDKVRAQLLFVESGQVINLPQETAVAL